MSFSVLFIIRKVHYVGEFIFPRQGHENEIERLSISARDFEEVKTHIDNLIVKHANEDAEVKVRVVHGATPKKLQSWLKKNKDRLYLRAKNMEGELAT
jgi:aspartokinase-like uncharacterized kinase